MKIAYSVLLRWWGVCAAAPRPHTWDILLLVILGGLSFADQVWLLGGFLALPKALAATSCEGELPEDADPPQVAVGERLFLETRFAQFFFAHSDGNANAGARGPVVT